MTYKTVVAYLPSEKRVTPVMAVAARLADENEAHLTGLHVIPMVHPYGAFAVEMQHELLEKQRASLHQTARDVEATFKATAKSGSYASDWRCVEADYGSLGTIVADQIRSSDIVVIPQDENDPYEAWEDLPANLALNAGRPVLVVPHAGSFDKPMKRVLVAWNGTREAARAAFDALPILKRADEVRVMVINPKGERRRNTLSAGDDLALALARHGVKAQADVSYAEDISVHNELLSRISDFGSDLLVMGCYGHSRLREFVFGGATRGILNSMTVPVLMSH